MAPFGIKKRLKALIRRLKVRNVPSIVRNYPIAGELVDNTISIIDVFKKQRSGSKVFLVTSGR